MPTILYVDDDDDIREIVEMALELDPEMSLRMCSSGAQALGVVADWAPDLVLLDVMMPGMDGPETLSRLRAEGLDAAVPVVFITARSQDKEVERLKMLGAAGVIAKPFDPMNLGQQVKALLG